MYLIINKQKEILKKSHGINSRGIAYAQGNAHFTFLDRTYSLGKDSVANSNVDVTVTVKSDIDLEESFRRYPERDGRGNQQSHCGL